MKDLMIWCTCAEANKACYLLRVAAWHRQLESLFRDRDPDYFVFVDGEVSEKDLAGFGGELSGIRFVNITPALGRASCAVFPGWKRSLSHALAVGRDYRHIHHDENDVAILHASKIREYLDREGYYAGLCKTYGFMESALMILNDKRQNETLIRHYSSECNLKEDLFFEIIAPVLCKFRMVFDTDRFEGRPERCKQEYDYICQTA